MSAAGTSRRGRLLLHAALLVAAAIVTVPVAGVVAAGFRTQISLLLGEFFFEPIWTNFATVLSSNTSDFVLNFRNSLIVGVASTALCLAVATRAAWSLHRMRWPGWGGARLPRVGARVPHDSARC